jgi:hypothetical protein
VTPAAVVSDLDLTLLDHGQSVGEVLADAFETVGRARPSVPRPCEGPKSASTASSRTGSPTSNGCSPSPLPV